MAISFQSAVIFVEDIQRSRRFYEGLLGQKVEMDFGPSVEYQGGFALWEVGHAYPIIFDDQPDDRSVPQRAGWGLAFNADDLNAVWSAMQQTDVPIIHPPREQPWGPRVFRVYDPDGSIVTVAEPMPAVIQRWVSEGLPIEAIAERTGMPFDVVRQMAAGQTG
jgi:catechol 2,3-dioxygenase-like lactoylglutathione lyase family enzyme